MKGGAHRPISLKGMTQKEYQSFCSQAHKPQAQEPADGGAAFCVDPASLGGDRTHTQ